MIDSEIESTPIKATQIKKPRGIPDEQVKLLTSKIINQLRVHDLFGAKITLRSILKLPGKGNKVLRYIYITILGSPWTLTSVLRAGGSQTAWSSELMRTVILEKMTRLLNEMDSKGLVKPGKLYTLPKINSRLLSVDPEVLTYLFESGKIIPGKKFTIATSVNSEPISKYMARSFTHEAVSLENEGSLAVFGLDRNIMFDEIRLRINLIERIKNNLVYQIKKFGHIFPNINTNALTYLSLEFTACDKLDQRSSYYRSTITQPETLINSEEFPLFAAKLRQSIFESITIASDAINAHDRSDIDPFTSHNINIKNTSFYLDDIKKEVEKKGLEVAKNTIE